ncbi:methyl-accepting chemotaxis protein [Clostridium magnum]|uniref:methyl-accepting chemotaxis protein n=1 Tax=Clostridium magnum TaxID=33954 RepID=UPI001FA7AEA2|nr:HAMP domain-containing methyl-accepting chemotaxis protein [Clostridium magnum]
MVLLKNAMFRNRSLKLKITLSALLVLMISTLLLAIISLTIINKKFENQVKEDGMSLVEEISTEVENNNLIVKQLDSLLGEKILTVAYLVGENANISNEYLLQVAKDINVQEINVVNPSGEIIYSNLPENIGYKYLEDHPVQPVLQGKESKVVEQVRQSSNSADKNYYKYGASSLKNGGLIQVGILANEVQKVGQAVNNQTLVDRLGKKQNIVYALTIDTNLKAATHSDKSRIGISLTDEGSKTAVKDGKMYSSLYKYKGEEYVYDVIMPIRENDTVIGAANIGLSLKNEKAAIRSIIISFVVVTLLLLIIGGFILRFIVGSTLNPLDKLALAAENVAEGDLTKNIEIETNDEVGKLGLSFNNMISNLKNIVVKINEMSGGLATSSKALLSSAEQASASSEEISISTQEVANGAEKQVNATEEISSSIKVFVGNVLIIKDQINEIVKFSDDTNILASSGKEKMNDMIKQIETIKSSVNYSSEVISELQRTSKEIGNIVEIIDGIADQTNLLALNASIEAARAGEAGRGFAVVADEVRKLAEESMRSSSDIKQLIVATQSRTDVALESIERGNKEAEKGQEIVEIVGKNLNEIIKSFDYTKENLEKVNERIINSKDEMDKIDGNLQDIQGISTNTAANTEQVAASSQEQAAILQEISYNVQKLTNMAEELENSINTFKI